MKLLDRISYDTKFGAAVASLMMLLGLVIMAVLWIFKP